MRKWIVLAILVIGVYAGYKYLYHEHRDVKSEDAIYSLTATEIYNEFKEAPVVSQKKYLNKTIELSGSISEKNETEITIDDKAFCQFSNILNKKPALNSKIKIKGRFIGYDDLLEQVKLDQCIIN